MARGRARWKKAFDPKPHLSALFTYLQKAHPSFTSALRYYSIGEPVTDLEIFEKIERPHLFRDGVYADAYRALSINNVDAGKTTTASGYQAAFIEGCILPGHALFPVRQQTQRVVGHGLCWGFTYPSPTLRSPIQLKGTCIAIPHIKNYYHIMIDHILPAVSCIIKNPNIFNEKIHFISRVYYKAAEVFVDILREMGFDAEYTQIELLDTVHAERVLWVKSSGGSVEHAYAFTPEMEAMAPYIDKRIADVKTPARIYIPRTKTRIRNIENQEQLQAILEQRGIVPIGLGWGNFLDQIAAFRRAELVVSAHGAGLTNLMFGSDAKVIEFFAHNARKTTYLHIASQHRWNYTPLFGSLEGENQNFKAPLEEINASI